MRRMISVALAAGCLFACSSGPEVDIDALKGHRYSLADGSTATWQQLSGARGTVLITLDPECPFCQGYAPLIDSLAGHFEAGGLRFIGIHCSEFIPADSALQFAESTGLDLPQAMDPDCTIARALHARVTPECFLLDARGALIYRGAIDDWAVRAGKHRTSATRHYLSDAIDALIAQRAPGIAEVTAKGCIVECIDTGAHE